MREEREWKCRWGREAGADAEEVEVESRERQKVLSPANGLDN